MPECAVEIYDDIFNPVYMPYRDWTAPVEIFYGGGSSGKSKFLAQRTIEDLLTGGRNYLITRNVGNTLRASVFNEMQKVIDEWGVRPLFLVNKSDMVFTCRNGYQAYLKGLDDPEKIKSITPLKGVITDIWIEEATEISVDAFKQLIKRLRGKTKKGIKKRIVLSFNPILKSHWIYKEFFKKWDDTKTVYQDDKLFILKTTYKNNQFLEPEDVERIESETDSYYYEVYTLGNWGVLGNLIFKKWRKENLKVNEALVKTFDIFQHGLDFGFTNDPTAYNKIYYHKASKTLYVLDEWHDRGVTNPDIATELKGRGINGDRVVCDSAEPKSIAELCTLNVNAVGAKKGKDSIKHGIQWLQQQNIVIDMDCTHTINEFSAYHWKKNKEGEVLNEPVDRDNHHIDGIRYAMEDYMLIGSEDDEPMEGDLLESVGEDWN